MLPALVRLPLLVFLRAYAAYASHAIGLSRLRCAVVKVLAGYLRPQVRRTSPLLPQFAMVVCLQPRGLDSLPCSLFLRSALSANGGAELRNPENDTVRSATFVL